MDPILLLVVLALVAVAVVGGAFVAVRSRGREIGVPKPQADETPAVTPTKPDVALDQPDSDVLEEIDVDDPDLDLVEEEQPTPIEEPVAEPEPPAKKPSFFDRLGKARSAFTGYLGGLAGLSRIDGETWEDLEDALIQADVGVQTSMTLIEDVQAEAKAQKVDDGAQVLELLKARMHRELEGKDRSLTLDDDEVNVWLFVGVNGVGKTTTIGKLGKRLTTEGHTPLMAAGDTFRAAAAEQLGMWAERSDSQFVRGSEGGDPSSVIFDGVQAAASRGCDVVLADTAGRLHNKSNLMDELAKVRRVAAKDPGHVSEVLLVLDATTGQNGMSQAKVFTEAVDVTGVVLTKLDGSAKGGIVFAIESELGIPVKLVGLGEGVNDLVDFEPTEFVDALFE